jgi:hypothetical protein
MVTFTQTATYDQPALAYTPLTGVSVPTSPNPYVIPLTITEYTPPMEKTSVNLITQIPIIQDSNFAYAGTTVADGVVELAKLTCSGFIDSPMTTSTEAYAGYTAASYVPSITINSIRATWSEFIIMCLEGRVSTDWNRYDPLWFRDSYGRQFNLPRILDFTATYVEGVPGRTNFTLNLKV